MTTYGAYGVYAILIGVLIWWGFLWRAYKSGEEEFEKEAPTSDEVMILSLRKYYRSIRPKYYGRNPAHCKHIWNGDRCVLCGKKYETS